MKKIQRLKIINFQSHENTEVNFCYGLNVIGGDSRNGKTSILRALRWVYFNEPRGTGYIRAGETRCEVAVTLSDGTKVERIRDNKVNCYVLSIPGEEKQVFSKFNNDVPLEVQRALGVSKLWIDKDKAIALNFAYQMAQAFLVSDSRGQRAKIIGRIMHLHVIDSARRSTQKDLSNAQQRKTALEADLKVQQEKMLPFEDLPEQEAAYSKACELLATARELEEKASKLEKISVSILGLESEIAETEAKLIFLDNLDTARTAMEGMSSLASRCVMLTEVNQNIQFVLGELKSNNNLLEQLNRVPEGEEIVNEMTCMTNRLAQLETLHNSIQTNTVNLQSAAAVVNNLKDIAIAEEAICQIKERFELANHLAIVHQRIQISSEEVEQLNIIIAQAANLDNAANIITALYKLRERGFILNDISKRRKDLRQQLNEVEPIIAKTEDIDRSTATITQLKTLTERLGKFLETQDAIERQKKMVRAYQVSLKDLNEKSAKLRNNYTTLLGEIDTCPICHTVMTPEVIAQLAK